ncbi:MAG: hypothetical protein AAFP00_05035 [Bacteroidota bacterium]
MAWISKAIAIAVTLLSCLDTANAQSRFIGTLDISERYSDLGYWAESDLFRTAPPRTFLISSGTSNHRFDALDAREMQLAPNDFELMETSYEYKELSVYGMDGDWVRVKLKGESVWLRVEPTDQFTSYLSLIEGRLAYTTDSEFPTASSAGGETVQFEITPEMQNTIGDYDNWVPSIEVVETKSLSEEVGKSEWIKIRVLDQEPCERYDLPPEIVFEGWIPAYLSSGDVSVWYYPRGC